MAENDQTQEKTQEPTQRRLEKAREDGDVLSSKEMFVFASSAVGLLVLTILGFFANSLLNTWGTLFSFYHPEDLLKAKSFNSWQSFRLIIQGCGNLCHSVFCWSFAYTGGNWWWFELQFESFRIQMEQTRSSKRIRSYFFCEGPS